MRSAPTELVAELVKEANRLCFLVELELASTLRYTDLDLDLVWNGNTYSSRGLSFTAAEYSISPQVDKITFEIDNVDLAFSSVILNQEVRNKKCNIRLCALNWPAQIIGVALIFSGVIDRCSFDHQRARFEVLNPFVFWRRKVPRRIHQPTCPWAFKSTECGYTGEESWCDKSFDRCSALANTDNFGGFRFLPSLINKKIWWGRVGS